VQRSAKFVKYLPAGGWLQLVLTVQMLVLQDAGRQYFKYGSHWRRVLSFLPLTSLLQKYLRRKLVFTGILFFLGPDKNRILCNKK